MPVTTGEYYPESAAAGSTMDGMTTPGAHARPAASHDHLWVLAVIAAACLAEVWASWVGIGAVSGFPDLGRMHTDWILAVVMEAYWAYALYAWLAASPGPRSRSFAMWSCAAVFGLSLIGQVSYHEMTVPAGMPIGRRVVVGFVTALPVTVLALIAVLIHLRHLDRAEAAEAGKRSTVQAEMDALRVQVGELTSDLEAAVTARAGAEQRAAEALTRAEQLAQKLAAKNAQGKRSPTAQDGGRRSAQEVDLTTEARALTELDKNPSLRGPRMGGELARRLGVSAATGRRLHAKLTAQDPAAGPLSERSRIGPVSAREEPRHDRPA